MMYEQHTNNMSLSLKGQMLCQVSDNSSLFNKNHTNFIKSEVFIIFNTTCNFFPINLIKHIVQH
jgi:hypothetical protein